MDAAVDIQPALATAALGIKHITPVYAAIPDVGVFELEWKVTTRVLVPAGSRMVVIWTKLVRNPTQGLSHAVLHLEPGQQVGLRWRAPSSIFGAGAITLLTAEPPVRHAVPAPGVAFPPTPGKQQIGPPHPVEALVPLAGPPPSPGFAPGVPGAPVAPVAPVQPVAPAPPAGAWHPDPTGRFAHRWWDGTRWTDAVSDGTTTSSDPLPGG